MKKRFLVFPLIVLLIISCFVYINRSHIGYFEYLYKHTTDKEVYTMEEKLLIILEKDPENLFKEFSLELDRSPKSQNVCHGIAHKLGHESFELYGLETSMDIAKPICGGGFIHGVLESMFGTFVDGEDLLDELADICQAQDESCNHGLGHGLMVVTNNDFRKSLSYCDLLDSMAHSDCYDGVFMHIFDNEETGISKDIKERYEAEKLCNNSEERYQKSCAFYLPRIFVGEDEIGIKSYYTCMKVNEYARISCFFGSGTMFGKYIYDDHDKAKQNCDIFGDDKWACIQGVNHYIEDVF